MSNMSSIDAVIEALYSSVSCGPGGSPDYARLRSCFLPGATLLPPNDDDLAGAPLSVEEFVELSAKAFEGSPSLKEQGFAEREVARKTDRFATIAQVFSTYEAVTGENTSRGLNSMQLVFQQERWWVVSMIWDDESPKLKIPDQYC